MSAARDMSDQLAHELSDVRLSPTRGSYDNNEDKKFLMNLLPTLLHKKLIFS